MAVRTRVVVAVQEIQQEQRHRSSWIHGVSDEPDMDEPAGIQHCDVEEPQYLPTRFGEEPIF
jgi:hypothetical protein